MTNFRMTNDEGIPNDEVRDPLRSSESLLNSDLIIDSSSVIRHSSFPNQSFRDHPSLSQ